MHFISIYNVDNYNNNITCTIGTTYIAYKNESRKYEQKLSVTQSVIAPHEH